MHHACMCPEDLPCSALHTSSSSHSIVLKYASSLKALVHEGAPHRALCIRLQQCMQRPMRPFGSSLS